MTEDEIARLETELRELRKLKESKGFSILEGAINADILSAALDLADNPVMSEKEIDFRRGAIAAARNFLFVIPRLIQSRENELLMAKVDATAAQPS